MAKRLGSCPFGRMAEFNAKLAHPERTGYKYHGMLGEDAIYQEWPNRASLARSIRMQERRERKSDDWRAVVPLSTTEGY